MNVGKFKVHLKWIALIILEGIQHSRAWIDSVKEQDTDNLVEEECFNEMNDSLGRLKKIMRFVGCLLSDEASAETKDLDLDLEFDPSTDIMWLVSYRGKGLEKNLSEIVHGQEWTAICDDVVRTADSAVRLKPQCARAMETLEALPEGRLFLITLERFQELIELTPQLLQGMRRSQADVFCSAFRQALVLSAEDLASGKQQASAVGTKRVEHLLGGLKVVSHIPGTDSVAEKLRTWMTQNAMAMAWSHFHELAQEFDESGVADVQKVLEAMGKLQKQAIPEGEDHLVTDARKLLIATFRGFTMEARWALVTM